MTLSCQEQLRRDLLIKALEVFRDTEAAMTATLEMERFVLGRDSGQAAAGPVPFGQNNARNGACAAPAATGHGASAPCEVGRRRRWAAADDALLRRLWSEGFTANAISQRLNRSEASVATRASVLKLRRAADRPLLRAVGDGPADDTARPADAVVVNGLDAGAPTPTPRANDGKQTGRAAGARRPANGTAWKTPVAAAPNDHVPDGAIDTVIRFLRSRDYSVVRTDDGLFRLDEREDLTIQELLSRANRVRAYLQQPPFPAMAS